MMTGPLPASVEAGAGSAYRAGFLGTILLLLL